MRTPEQRLKRDQSIVKIVAWLAIVWIFIQANIYLFAPDQALWISLFANGSVFAFYAGLFYAIRGGRGNYLRAAVIIVLGMTHFLWGKLAQIFTPMLGMPFSFIGGFGGMLSTTALILGLTIAALSERSVLLVHAYATAALASLTFLQLLRWITQMGWGADMFPLIVASSIAVIHFGLLAALVPDTHRALRAKHATKNPIYCSECGYDLRGLPSNQCPECGRAPLARA